MCDTCVCTGGGCRLHAACVGVWDVSLCWVCVGADVGHRRLCGFGKSWSSVCVAGLFRGLSRVCRGLWELELRSKADWDLIRTLNKYNKHDFPMTSELRFGLPDTKETVAKQTTTRGHF